MSGTTFKITIALMILVFLGIASFMVWDSGILQNKSGSDVSVSDSPPDATKTDYYFLAKLGTTTCEEYIGALKIDSFSKTIITTSDVYEKDDVVDYNPESCLYTLDDGSTVSLNLLYDPLGYDLENTYKAVQTAYTYIPTDTGCSLNANVGSVTNLDLSITFNFDCSTFEESKFKDTFDSVSKVFETYFTDISKFRRY